jgi:hypothetical protein
MPSRAHAAIDDCNSPAARHFATLALDSRMARPAAAHAHLRDATVEAFAPAR